MKNTLVTLFLILISSLGYAATPKLVNMVAGGLSSSLTPAELSTVTELTITGSIDARDFKTIRDDMPALIMLDLSGATISSYTGSLGTAGTSNMTYPANTFPAYALSDIGTQNGKTTLVTILFSSGLVSVGDGAFRGCTGLKTCSIPSSVTSIGSNAFSGCVGLDTVTIPGSVNLIGDYAFSGCSGSFLVEASNPVYASMDGLIFNKSMTRLIQCPVSKTGNLWIPSSVTTIGNAAFQGCSGFVGSLSIPSSVTTIGYYAFENCSGLAGQLTIPSSVISIGVSAFAGCTGLSSMSVPSLHMADVTSFLSNQFTKLTLTGTMDARDFLIMRDHMPVLAEINLNAATIAAYTGTMGTAGSNNISYAAHTVPADAFYNSSSQTGKTTLMDITFPSETFSIGNNAFRGCLSLAKLSIPSSVTAIGVSAFEGCTGVGALTTPSLHIADLTSFPNANITRLTLNGQMDARDFRIMRDNMPILAEIDMSMATIAGYTGNLGTSGTDVVSYNANTIPVNAFYHSETGTGKSTLTAVRFPTKLVALGDGAFQDCTGLTDLTIPDSVATIGTYVFSGCKGLSSVFIPKSVNAIGAHAFSGSVALIDVDLSNESYASVDGILFNKNLTHLIQCPIAKTGIFVIPSTVTTIENGAFQGCTGFTGQLTIPLSVTSIGKSAFEGCTGLTSLSAPALHLADATSFQDTRITKLILTGNIDARDFRIMRDRLSLLENIDLGSAVIDAYTGNDGTAGAGTISYPANTIPEYAFYNPVTQKGKISLITFQFPAGLTSIGNDAFYDCNKMDMVNIPRSVNSIGDHAFLGCSGLFNVDSSNVQYASLDGILFSKDETRLIQCPVSKTGNISIPSSVTIIENSAFRNVTGLTGLLAISPSVTSIGDYAFDGCTGLVSMTASSLHIGQATSFENTSMTRLTLTGTIDASDFKIMRDNMSLLADVDLTDATIAAYTGTLGTAGTNSITYPENTIPVYAFSHLDTKNGKTTLTDIKFPAALVSIGEYAFRGCTGLTGLSIPLSVTSIGGGVFMDCSGLTGALVIPSSITSVGSRAFQNCTGFTEPLVIPSSVTAIGSYAFAGCIGFKSLTAPSLHIADATSFENTPILKLILTSTVDARDFKLIRDNLPALTDVDLSGTTVDAYTGIAGPAGANVLSYPSNTISEYAFYSPVTQNGKAALTAIAFPANIVSIGNDAFRGCQGLTLVLLPSTVENIGNEAFLGCIGLMSVPFTKSLNAIGSSAFLGCTSLTGALQIPSIIKVIEASVFKGCTGLTTLTIPSSVTSIGASAFAGCTAITELTLPSFHMADETSFPDAQIKKVTLTDTINARDFKIMRDHLSILSIADLSGATIAAYSGALGTAANDTISYSADRIPAYAFNDPATQKGKTTLKTLHFPAAIVSVENNAFKGCSALTSVSIPSSVTKIGENAFRDCIHVDTVRIPQSVLQIDDYAFNRCGGFFMVDVNNAAYASLDGILYNKVFTQLIQCPLSKTGNPSIPPSVTVIGRGAFQDCAGLIDTLLIPSKVTIIENLAFSGCTGFNGLLNIPSAVSSIGASAFAGCTRLTSLNATSLHIADSTAFVNTPISKLTLVGTINASDFKHMRDNLSVLAEADLTDASIAAYTGTHGTLGTNSISYSANMIPASAFFDSGSQNGKSSLRTIHFPVGLISFGDSAFRGCTGLTGLSIPNSVTTVENAAFSGCTGLTGLLTIPSLVKSIGLYAFSGCTGLAYLTAPALHIADITSFPYAQFTKLTLNGNIDARDFKVMRDNMSVLAEVYFCDAKISAYTGALGTVGTSPVTYPENSIPDHAFYFSDTQSGKTTLESVCLPTGLQSIGDGAFRGCSGFSSIQILSSVTSIGNYAFLGFSGSILVDEKNEAYSDDNGALFNKVLTRVIQCPTSATGIFSNPVSVTTVGNGAFYGCSNLTSIRMPATVHYIGDSAFMGCSGLQSLYAYKALPVDLSSSIDVFKEIALNTCKLYIPNGSLTYYELAAKWKDFLNITNVEMIQIDTLETPEAGCVGHNQELSYRIISGKPDQYQVSFDSTALSVGFQNLAYTNLPTSDSSGVIPFEIPLGAPDGTYMAYLQMRDTYGLESLPYAFRITVNLSADSIIAKFDDVVFCDNSSKRFVRYQWYKDGEIIPSATRQYYSDPEGLVGSYSVTAWTIDGREVNSCPKALDIPLISGKSVTVTPNPVQKGQPCSIITKGLSDEDLNGASMDIFDTKGISIFHSDDISQLHTLTLPISAGIYLGNVTTKKGEKFTFEFVVSD